MNENRGTDRRALRRLTAGKNSGWGIFTQITLTTGMAMGIGVLLGGSLFLPLLQAALVYPVYVRLIRLGRWLATMLAMFYWAILNGILVSALSALTGDWMESRVLFGDAYRQEMFHWILTGVGPESNIAQFLPEHVFHLLLFCTLTVISGGFLGLLMGAILMNYMSNYVGAVLSHTSNFWTSLCLAWPVWAMLRVAGFILIAIGLTSIVYGKWGLTATEEKKALTPLSTGLVLILSDVLLKWLLAPPWREWLARFFLR